MNKKFRFVLIILTCLSMLVIGMFAGCSNGETTKPNPSEQTKPTEPNKPVEPVLTPLTAPVIALDGNIVEWEDVENAAYYEVTINGTSVKAIGGFYVINVTESGNYEVTVKAVPATNSAYSESASSNKVVYTYTKPEQPIKPEKPVQLTAPVIKLNGSTVSWGAVQNAASYEVTVNGVAQTVNGTSYTVTNTANEEYRITVKAIASDEKFTNSAPSNEVVYIITVRLATPAISLSGNIVSWQAVENATAYEVTVNGVAQTVNGTSYTVTSTESGEYRITVKAIASGERFTNSASSNEVVYTITVRLATPVIALSGNIVSWQAIENATAYEITVNGKTVRGLGTSYVISNTESGEYTVTVKAISSNSVYSESLSSNSVLYVKPFVLATPVISLSGNTVSWQAVENATAYEVTVNGVAQTVQDTSFTVNNVDAGEYTITVKAISNDVHYTTSSLSAPVVYVKADKLSVPQVTLQGDTVNWEPVQNATSYVISMVGIAPVSVEGSVVTETVETTSYTLEMAYTGEYSVTVKAVCGSAEYADSPESAALHYDNYKRIDPNEYLAMHRVWAPDPDGNGIQNHGGVIADNVYLEENGDVVITANGSYYEGNKKGISSVENYAANYGGKRTGGVIISKDTYGPGSFEVVMKIPAFNDIVSTIWLYKWLEGYEDYNHEMDIEIYGATPWGGDASFDYAMCSTWLRETDPYHDVQTVPVKYKLNDGKLHTYRFDWHLGDNPHADFYMDNVYICSNYKAIPTNEMNMNIGCWFASWGGASNFETDSLVIKSFKYTPFDNEEATRYDCGTIIPNAAGQYRNINRGTAPKTNLISNYNFNASRDNFVWDTSAGTITNGKLNGTVSQNVEVDAAGITYDLTVKASGKIKIKVTYSSIADTPSKGSVEFEFESTSLTEKTFRFTPPPDAKAPDDFRQHQNGVTALIIEITSDSGATVEYVYMTEHDACGR